jgi:hypothetical protein
VYYLWLVLPFSQQLQLLALDDQLAVTRPSPFFWALPAEKEKREGEQSPQPSKWLSAAISREFKLWLDTEANIQVWRHVIIAINRRHLRQAKFKKDFDIGTTWNDEQAGHSTYLAGSIYARGVEEAAGHVASQRVEYQQISWEWHSWLGFALYLATRATGYTAPTPAPALMPAPKAGTRPPKRKALADIPLNKVVVAKRGRRSK